MALAPAEVLNSYTGAMKTRAFDPLSLDVELFARDAASLQGQWPAAELDRLADAAAPESPASGWPLVAWAAVGEQRAQRGAEAQTWLHLTASASVALTCQRCLRPVAEDLQIDRWFHFVRGEEQAANLDAELEDDVLAMTRHLNLRELLEDELLLGLPLVPLHQDCSAPVPMDAAPELAAQAETPRPNPFAALAALKGKKSDGAA